MRAHYLLQDFATIAWLFVFHETGNDPSQLLVCVLNVKFFESLSAHSFKLLLLGVLVRLFDLGNRLVENILELYICLGEFSAKLDVHVRCDCCSDDQRDPRKPIANIYRNGKSA